jgi:uncharacterized protein (UPF0179 family)
MDLQVLLSKSLLLLSQSEYSRVEKGRQLVVVVELEVEVEVAETEKALAGIKVAVNTKSADSMAELPTPESLCEDAAFMTLTQGVFLSIFSFAV